MKLLASLPPLPARMRSLPVDARGYPVPWFVAWLDADGRSVPRGQGTPDFRVVSPAAISTAVSSKLCWICGQKRGELGAFLIGPMCAVNRVSSEPPSHPTCAEFAALACPFLVNPARKRREKDMPPGWVEPAGTMVRRNPGVTLLWAAKTFGLMAVENGVLFELPPPEYVRWFAEGRAATREEVAASVAEGLPTLVADAAADPGGLEALAIALEQAQVYFPALSA